MKTIILKDKSKVLALQIIQIYKYLQEEKKEFILSKQLLRSGTSIGANIAEAFYGQSVADFISKLSIAQKETSETSYWIDLLYSGGFISDKQFQDTSSNIIELMRLLTSSIKKMKTKLNT